MPDRIRTLTGAAALTTTPFEEALALQRAGQVDRPRRPTGSARRTPPDLRARMRSARCCWRSAASEALQCSTALALPGAAVLGHRGWPARARDFAGAVASYDRAQALGAADADLHFNRANALNELRRFDEALGRIRSRAGAAAGASARAAQPRHPQAAARRLRRRPADYEARRPPEQRARAAVARRRMARRAARRQVAAGHRRHRHGRRDAHGSLPVRARRSRRARVLPRQAGAVPLFAPFAARVQLLREVPADAHFDYQCKLLSLPYLLGHARRLHPASVPYLFAEPRWRSAGASAWARDGFRIGIGWKGNPRAASIAGRSIPARRFPRHRGAAGRAPG
jgi:hypothetical protein